ncbi:uncharacterized protein AFUA_1G17420 [Aspergillus fumigatus Af293]|uniref:Uncharacterized protein n=2 Tax=Aspergillus fumigatus TaxID=746128 RepID=Q4WR61_ASPFU|nr:hypothetical protein AFUA_1G17420 [Aspergillus fumigatus Af293]EAL91071.1 hypothetical protein AFUA_1G17420 [Aspergillus fumigatus Af293]EDP56957.1 hypothetical protein AFUB_016790 [Aspergillus fumigatus A1163]KEY82155.1 hypothetical protein BA78_7523 [Aspergillus fumigatus]
MPPEFDCQCTLHWRSTFDKPNASMQPPGKTSAELTVNGNAQDPIVAPVPQDLENPLLLESQREPIRNHHPIRRNDDRIRPQYSHSPTDPSFATLLRNLRRLFDIRWSRLPDHIPRRPPEHRKLTLDIIDHQRASQHQQRPDENQRDEEPAHRVDGGIDRCQQRRGAPRRMDGVGEPHHQRRHRGADCAGDPAEILKVGPELE